MNLRTAPPSAAAALVRRAGGVVRRGWLALRTLSGDDAFERYLLHHQHCHPGTAALGRREFYLQEQRRKWSGVSRCC
ncbi:MAG: YbdD/YjiX family protein [Proteobacteria bacterium]|nr:YbdD/YjiX family protein [Pseudomonadota bacterium]